VILTDQQGLYSADPRKDPDAIFINFETAGNPALEKMAGGAGSNVGTGGMLTKILAAKRAAKSGAHTIIASGREPNVLVTIKCGRGDRHAPKSRANENCGQKTMAGRPFAFRWATGIGCRGGQCLTKEGKSYWQLA
jgi:glutamate 5-kinase